MLTLVRNTSSVLLIHRHIMKGDYIQHQRQMDRNHNPSPTRNSVTGAQEPENKHFSTLRATDYKDISKAH